MPRSEDLLDDGFYRLRTRHRGLDDADADSRNWRGSTSSGGKIIIAPASGGDDSAGGSEGVNRFPFGSGRSFDDRGGYRYGGSGRDGNRFTTGSGSRFDDRGNSEGANRFASGSGNRFVDRGGDRYGGNGDVNRTTSGYGRRFDNHGGYSSGGSGGGSRFDGNGSGSRFATMDVDIMASQFAALKLKKSTAANHQNVWCTELGKTTLEIFQPLLSFGCYSWKPQGEYMPLSTIQSETAITSFIDSKGEPPRLENIQRIKTNIPFQSPPSNQFNNLFPYGDLDIASIHVAVQRGVKLDEVDFCFGGSALEMLVQRLPGTKCIVVAKKQQYEKKLADLGFQFERHVTGRDMMDSSDCSIVKHIHTMKVGGKVVLFYAEVDAVNDNGVLVEIKASNPRYWGSKLMFQMMSNGCPLLCHGVKSRQVLMNVTVMNFASVAREALSQLDVKELEKNIIQGMKSIEEQILNDLPHRVVFSGGKLILKQDGIVPLFPPEHIVAQLLKKR